MADLHARLDAAIRARQAEATELLAGAQSVREVLKTPQHLGQVRPGWGYWPQVVEAAQHIIRQCERDLKVLERHAELPNSWGSCSHCRTSNGRGESVLVDCPCPDVLDLLDVYPEASTADGAPP